MQMPSDEIMSAMSKLALETATASLADFAERFAREADAGLLPPMSAGDALRAFAAAIRSNNARHFPPSAKGRG